MKIAVTAEDATRARCDLLAVGIPQGSGVPRALRTLDAALDGGITEAFESGDFTGKPGEPLRIPARGIEATRVALIGLGEESKLDGEAFRNFAARALRLAQKRKADRVALAGPPPRRVRPELLGTALAEGARLGAYRFERYRTIEPATHSVEEVRILASDRPRATRLRKGARLGLAVANATAFARDLSNEPGSICTPAHLAHEARSLSRQLGLRCRILGEKELLREKMGGILAVGRGSIHPPRLIVLEHRAPTAIKKGSRRRPTIALVGKGVTFDSGGISLKPSASMDEMKHDMSGGAAVLGTMRAVAELDLPLHVVGIVGAAENKPDGNAYLPGDIVTTSSGKTIEVLNTDAEGRIVLSDALHYATRFEPSAIIDLATLTGACMVALGSCCAGALGNESRLAERVRAAGERSGERVWPLPLWDEHKKAIESHIADVKNTGGREAGTSTAAAFLSHFVGDTPWVHLDIAGTAWTKNRTPTCLKGATGFGVRLLVELLRSWRS